MNDVDLHPHLVELTAALDAEHASTKQALEKFQHDIRSSFGGTPEMSVERMKKLAELEGAHDAAWRCQQHADAAKRVLENEARKA